MQIEIGSMYKVRNKKSKTSYLLSFDHKGEMILCGFDKNKVYRERPTTNEKLLRNYEILSKLEK
ncbi:hypothetical protein [Cytobacillus horneckiae]|uniref:hypothetical protein n=1 Tax=Cytobacillus horneckiae TaxID=549687 RepID=UPI003D9A9CE8